MKKRIKRGQTGFLLITALLSIMLIGAFCFSFYALDATGVSVAIASGESPNAPEVGQPSTDASGSTSGRTAEKRMEEIANSIELIRKAEERGYENKMMARELIRYIKVVVVVLVVIAVAFPLTIWLMSRKRILGLSGLSPELATTLLVIEERQAKLANILKEIQGEIDYLHTMSVPDLKSLIQQAENYLKQNEVDLDKAGRGRNTTETGQN